MPDALLEVHPEVLTVDMLEISSYIMANDEDAAGEVLSCVDETFHLLAEQPSIGTLYHPARRSLEGIRMIPAAPYRNYLIFYRSLPDDAGVRILYVLHAARDIATFMKEHQRR